MMLNIINVVFSVLWESRSAFVMHDLIGCKLNCSTFKDFVYQNFIFSNSNTFCSPFYILSIFIIFPKKFNFFVDRIILNS